MKSAHITTWEKWTDTIKRQLLRRSIEKQLFKLDARMLSDIGLVYDQIPTVARQAAGILPDSLTLGQLWAQLGQSLLRPLRAWWGRQRLYNELASLDGRMLADIGLTRQELYRLAHEPEAMEAKTLVTYPAAMTDYTSLPLAFWGKARIIQDGVYLRPAVNQASDMEAGHNRAA